MGSIYSNVIPNLLPDEQPTFATIKYDIANATILGEGTYGTAKLITDENTGKEYVIKISNMAVSKTKAKIMRREATILLPFKDVLDQNFIIQYFDYKESISMIKNPYRPPTEGHMTYALLEYFPFPELYVYIKKHHQMRDSKKFYTFAKNLFTAVDFLHRNNIVHRDIKTENILYDPKTQDMRLIDFGFACNDTITAVDADFGCLQDRKATTPGFAHPRLANLIVGNGDDDEWLSAYKSSDIWACGTVLYILITTSSSSLSYPPWDDMNIFEYIEKTQDSGLHYKVQNHVAVSGYDVRRLIKYCFDLDGKATATGALDICNDILKLY